MPTSATFSVVSDHAPPAMSPEGTPSGPKLKLAPIALRNQPSEGMRGFIDVMEVDAGIEGWALDLAEPARLLTLELLVGDEVVATTATGLPRDDIAEVLGKNANPGFHFPPEVFDGLERLADSNPGGVLRVRFKDYPLALKMAASAPILAPFIRHVPSAQAARSVELDPGRSPGSANGFSVMVRLSTLRSHAQALLDRIFRPSPDRAAGVIEGAALDDNGCVWLWGWMRRESVEDFPAVMVDRRKIPCGFSCAYYERDDLGPGAAGFMGVLLSEWRPAANSECILYYGEAGEWHLRTNRPLRIYSKAEFIDEFNARFFGSESSAVLALQTALIDPISWTPNAKGAPFPIQAAVDQVLVLPGFGCIVSGWALSPLKTISTFALKLGSTILPCDPNSLYHRARNDLGGIFPGSEKLATRAGFVGAFTGDLSARDLSNPVLKLLFDDGTAINFALEIKNLRRLGSAVPIEAAADYYPSLEAESFFPQFALAARADARSSLGAVRPYRHEPARKALIVGVSSDRSDLFLLIDDFIRTAHDFSADTGLALIAPSNELRSEIIALTAALSDVVDRPCSLFFVDDANYAFAHLESVLESLDAEHFVYVAPNVHLTASGVAAAASLLDAEAGELAYLEVLDAASELGGETSSLCFYWSGCAFKARYPELPFHLEGFRRSEFAGVKDACEVRTAAAVRGRLLAQSNLVAEINRR